MKAVISILVILFIVTSFLFISCSSPTTEELGDKYKNQAIALQGITFTEDENQLLNLFFAQEGYDGVTNGEFLNMIGPVYTETENTNRISVIVDMSAGLNIGIKESYEVMKELVSNLDPGLASIQYFHADEEDDLQALDFINSISDAIELQNPANFRKQFSKLRPALEHATERDDRITVVVTDFLLDEGDASTSRRFKDGVYRSGETADNTTWAKAYFEKWFMDNNTVIVFPYRYSARNYYNKDETKYIYYILFIPEHARNNDVDIVLDSFKKIMGDGYQFSPRNINVNSDATAITECNEAYQILQNSFIKPHDTANPLISVIPFSHDSIMEYEEESILAACDISVVNQSPFEIKVRNKAVDLSKTYYEGIRKEKSLLNLSMDPFSELEPLNDLFLRAEQSSSTFSLYFDEEVQRVNYMTGYQGYDKLLASGIFILRDRIKPMPEELAWEFESKYGTMVNDALSESIRLGLNQYMMAYPEQHVSTILFPIHDN